MNVLRLLSRLIRTTDLVSPRLAGRLAARLWFTPPRRNPRPVKALGHISELTFTVDGRPLWAFSAGEGDEIVLLVHGWGSSADRLAQFVGPLIEAGFRVVGVDLPGHGRNSARQTDPVELAGAVRAITEELGGVHAIVAHSMGAFATIIAMADGLEPQRVVFIAPLVRVESALRTFGKALNLPPRTARELERRLKRRFGENMLSDFALDRLAKDFDTTEALILHDPDDLEAPYQDAEALAAAWKTASLVEVSGLGHHGILRNGAVVNRTMRFINAERQHPESLDSLLPSSRTGVGP